MRFMVCTDRKGPSTTENGLLRSAEGSLASRTTLIAPPRGWFGPGSTPIDRGSGRFGAVQGGAAPAGVRSLRRRPPSIGGRPWSVGARPLSIGARLWPDGEDPCRRRTGSSGRRRCRSRWRRPSSVRERARPRRVGVPSRGGRVRSITAGVDRGEVVVRSRGEGVGEPRARGGRSKIDPPHATSTALVSMDRQGPHQGSGTRNAASIGMRRRQGSRETGAQEHATH